MAWREEPWVAKRKLLSDAQSDILRRQGLDPREFTLVKDLPNSMILFNVRGGDYQIVEKNAMGGPQ